MRALVGDLISLWGQLVREGLLRRVRDDLKIEF